VGKAPSHLSGGAFVMRARGFSTARASREHGYTVMTNR
jgi:hypothetical protein